MIEVFDRTRVKQAVLQNALNIEEDLKLNSLYTLTFSLPYDDPKNKYCNPFWLVQFNDRLYRIQPSALEISDIGLITYTCEHVIATLIDKVMFGYAHIGGIGVYTADVLRWILSHQSDWQLGKCDFLRQFEYGWEQETLLSALFSVPSRFTDLYMWDYDTKTYPWTLNLIRIDLNIKPQMYIRNEKNALQLNHDKDTQQICTRLYPLGYGEGVNQLNIRSVNNGIPYLQSPQEYIDKYGIVERVWIDRRYEDAKSLKQAGQAMLNELQEPYEEYNVSFAELKGGDYDEAEIGKVVEIIDNRIGIRKKSYVTEIKRSFDDIAQSTLTIANRSKNIASTVADMADRQRIEASYAQGATQVYSQSIQVNADPKNGAILDFFIPEDMRIINKVLLKVRTEPFRAFSKATEGGGSTTQTSGSSSSSTTSSGGGSTTTSGASSRTSTTNNADETTSDFIDDESGAKSWTANAEGPGSHRHTYTVHLPNHSHRVPGHSHGISHTHTIEIEEHSHNMDHTHTLKLPDHTHSITPGIYRFGSPHELKLIANNSERAVYNQTELELDLAQYLIDESGKIPRGSWQSVEVRPDDLAYITIVLVIQGFVQSRGDLTV